MNWLIEKIKGHGEHTAVIFKEREYTYGSLGGCIEEYIGLLSRRVAQGSVVALVSDYSFESIAMLFALYENRNVIVPITTGVPAEIEERIRVAKCEYRICLRGTEVQVVEETQKAERHELVSRLVGQRRAGLILFSSGSTGVPKAMIHDMDNLVDSYRNRKGKNLVFLIFLMFDHIGGLNTLLNCLAMGVAMVFPEDRNPESVARLIEKYKVNVLPASPTFLNLLLISGAQERYDLSSLRMITYGTEPMPDSLLVKLKATFGRVRFLQTFGTSETGITQTSSKSSTSTYIKFNDNETEYKIVNGELWLRSKTQIMGYLNSSMERFTEDGWFKTGDMVETTDDGYMKIVGRSTEIINVGGEKVLPSEVESVLYQMPGVMDCLVYPESNPITGQMVVAKMLFKEFVKPSEAKKSVNEFCKTRLAKYKIPVKVVLMTESEYSERFKKKRV